MPRWAATRTWSTRPAWPTTSATRRTGTTARPRWTGSPRPCGGFEGNAQTLRALTRLEAKILAPDGAPAGLNLTRAVLDATVKYPWPRREGERKFGVYADDRPAFDWVRAGAPDGRRCLEAQVMDWADDVAYSVHDVEDGVHAGHVKIDALDRAAVCELAADSYSPEPAGDLAAVLDDLLDRPVLRDLADYDGSRGAQVALKRATSELTGRFVSAAVAATRERAGDGPLRRYAADLVVPRRVAAECALLKAVAARYVMNRRRRHHRAVPAARAAHRAGRGLLADRAPAALDPALRPDWLAAPDDAARLRVVVDQVAGLTDLSAPAWHARLAAVSRGRRDLMDPYVIVGAGLAGAKAAETLRAEGFDGPVVLIGDEDELPYERPPLSKGYLLGKDPREGPPSTRPSGTTSRASTCASAPPVTAIHPAEHEVELAGGERIRYGKLLLATGSLVRPPERARRRPGAALLRKLPDADALKDALQRGGRVVVVGGGWIGLEVTAAAREYGAEVTLIEALAQPLARVLGEELGAVFADLHRAHGVDVRLNSGVKEITAVRRGTAGRQHAAGRPGAGRRRHPAGHPAGRRGRAGRGQRRRWSTPRCAPPTRTSTRPATWPTWRTRSSAGSGSSTGPTRSTAARRRPGRCSARTSRTTGCPTSSPTSTTWAWSTRAGPRRARTTGWSSAATWPGREFVAFWLSGGRVLAGMNVNVWDVTDAIQDLVRRGTPVDPDRLADPSRAAHRGLAARAADPGIGSPGGGPDPGRGHRAGPGALADRRRHRRAGRLRSAGGGNLKGLCPFHDEKSPVVQRHPGPRPLPLLRLRSRRRRHRVRA